MLLPTKKNAYNDRTVYTAANSFEKRGWKKVGTNKVDDAELSKTIRVVADTVWEQDQLLRKATQEDMRQYPIMYVDGFILVEDQLGKLLMKFPEKKQGKRERAKVPGASCPKKVPETFLHCL